MTKLYRLLSSGEYADFEIVCGEGDKEKKWKLHRSIVCTQSITIKDLVDGKMVSSLLSEDNTPH